VSGSTAFTLQGTLAGIAGPDLGAREPIHSPVEAQRSPRNPFIFLVNGRLKSRFRLEGIAPLKVSESGELTFT
jgi:hypothetical protein